jgi:hypothetical protein
MAGLSKHFAIFASNIEPEEGRLILAQQVPAEVRDHLKEHQELTTETPHTLLAGSYGRSTSIGAIKDVDVLVFVDRSWRKGKISDLMNTLKKALKNLPDDLTDGGEPEIRQQRRSVHVGLREGLQMDIVPVVMTTDSTKDTLVVPDRDWDKWVDTRPIGYAVMLSKLNSAHEDKVVPLVKMVKQWKEHNFTNRRPKSYWLEVLVYRHIDKGWVTTSGKGFAEILADLFSSIYERYEDHYHADTVPAIPDPALGNNVAWNWDRAAFETFMRRVEEAEAALRKAVTKDSVETAVDRCRSIFGDLFPAIEDVNKAEAREQAAQYADAYNTGSLYTTVGSGAGTISIGRPDVPAREIPKTRFYGEEANENA